SKYHPVGLSELRGQNCRNNYNFVHQSFSEAFHSPNIPGGCKIRCIVYPLILTRDFPRSIAGELSEG
ncbi:MAG: hypothetical protein MUO77_14540, partial [Anaerolineales bacterium]|nr:hypothetical protein [Anaerolineales bacterium]